MLIQYTGAQRHLAVNRMDSLDTRAASVKHECYAKNTIKSHLKAMTKSTLTLPISIKSCKKAMSAMSAMSSLTRKWDQQLFVTDYEVALELLKLISRHY